MLGVVLEYPLYVGYQRERPMRQSFQMYGHDESNRSLNDPWVTDQNNHLPARSSAQVFAQQNARSVYAPSSAVAVPRPARIPAGYMPYTQTTNMTETGIATRKSGVPHKTQPPINAIEDDFPAGSGGSAIGPDVYPPDYNQDVAGAGLGPEDYSDSKDFANAKPLDKKRKQDNPQKDRFRKNLKYGEYLSVPQGSKAIFTDKEGKPSKLPLFMGATLGILIIVAIIVWLFAF